LRATAGTGPRPSPRPRHVGLPRAGAPPQGAGAARAAVQERTRGQDLLGRGRRRAGRAGRGHRPAARAAGSVPRLGGGGGRGGPGGATRGGVLGRSHGSTRLELGDATGNATCSLPPPGGGRSVAEGDRVGVNLNRKSPHPGAQERADPPPPARGAQLRAKSAPGEGEEPRFTWLALEPLTGRAHPLRGHWAARGGPIVGDAIYGGAPRHGGPGLQLHAREVVVPLYKNREPIRVTAPVPAHMRETLTACGWNGEAEQMMEATP